MEHLRKIWRNPIENFRAWHYWKVSDVWHNPFCPFLLSLLFFLFSEWWLKSIECRVYAGEPNFTFFFLFFFWKKKVKEKRKWRSMERERWSKGFGYWERSFCCSLGFMNHEHEIIKIWSEYSLVYSFELYQDHICEGCQGPKKTWFFEILKWAFGLIPNKLAHVRFGNTAHYRNLANPCANGLVVPLYDNWFIVPIHIIQLKKGIKIGFSFLFQQSKYPINWIPWGYAWIL